MRRLFILSWLAAMIAWGLGGCGGGGGTSADPLGTDSLTFGHKNDSAGTDWSMAVQVNAKGTVVLTAKVKNAKGKEVAGREVTFGFKANQSGAALSASAVNTDAAGEAIVIYTAGGVGGLDVVRASLSNGAQMDANITVGSGGAEGRQISLTGSPTSLAAGQSGVLAATVTDSSGKVVSGQAVLFSFLTNQSGAPALTVLNLGLTDASGRTIAVYTAGASTPSTELQDTVKAEIVGSSAAVLILTRTSAAAAPSTRTLALSAGISSLTAGQSSILTARVTDSTGSPVSGQTVTFQFLGGVAAPSGATLAALNGGITDAGGQALAVYTAGAANPAANLQDTVQAGAAGSAGAVIISRMASAAALPAGNRMALTADVTSLAAGRSAVVTASVTEGAGNPVGGQTVTFALLGNNSGATLVPLNGGATDAGGKALAVYTAGAATPASIVQDTIQAGVTGSTGALVMTRTAAGGGVGTGVRMTVTATPASLVAGAMGVIAAQVNNADGTAAAGLTVTFGFVKNNSGAPALTAVNATTDASGTAVATYTAGSSSPGLSVQDAVSAAVTGSAGAAIITRLPATGTGNRISLTLTPATDSASRLGTTTGNCVLTATVLRDDNATPVANETVTFSIITGGGTLAPLTATTNNSGIAHAVFTAPGTATGNEAVVRAQILGTTNGGDAVGIIYW